MIGQTSTTAHRLLFSEDSPQNILLKDKCSAKRSLSTRSTMQRLLILVCLFAAMTFPYTEGLFLERSTGAEGERLTDLLANIKGKIKEDLLTAKQSVADDDLQLINLLSNINKNPAKRSEPASEEESISRFIRSRAN